MLHSENLTIKKNTKTRRYCSYRSWVTFSFILGSFTTACFSVVLCDLWEIGSPWWWRKYSVYVVAEPGVVASRTLTIALNKMWEHMHLCEQGGPPRFSFVKSTVRMLSSPVLTRVNKRWHCNDLGQTGSVVFVLHRNGRTVIHMSWSQTAQVATVQNRNIIENWIILFRWKSSH